MKAVRRPPVRGQEYEHEAQWGLPEQLPADEHILWQGQPEPRAVMRRVFHVRGVAVYFAAMLTWLVSSRLHDGQTWAEALKASSGFALLAAVAVGTLVLLGWLTARHAVYTLTDRRVVMRIGIVLTVTYNLPLRCIDGASLARVVPARGGRPAVGDIALAMLGDTRLAYLHLWPHARPWKLARTEPMLRCVPDAERVATRLATAWAAANEQPLPERVALPAEAGDGPAAVASAAGAVSIGSGAALAAR